MANLRFDKINVVRNTTPNLPFSFKWEDDNSARDVTGSVVKLRAYTEAGAVLFERTGVAVPGDSSSVTVKLLAADTATPGAYLAELELRTAGSPDDVQMWLGTVLVEGLT
jgi:hypothetical protein